LAKLARTIEKLDNRGGAAMLAQAAQPQLNEKASDT
jgi:hypothetical protein